MVLPRILFVTSANNGRNMSLCLLKVTLLLQIGREVFLMRKKNFVKNLSAVSFGV